MNALKIATDWAKAEVFSTPFFILFGLVFVAAGIGFWQSGKTELARAYIIPMVVAGLLLLIVGLGLFFTNKSRIGQFEKAYHQDAAAFVKSELARAESTLKEYKTIVFTAIPIIIAVCATGIMFISKPVWRASLITTIAMLVVILLIDGLAHARMEIYHKQLVAIAKQTGD